MGYQTADDYQSLLIVIREMPEQEQYELQRRIQALVGSSLIDDFISYIQVNLSSAVTLTVFK